jgi:hypothetical protein
MNLIHSVPATQAYFHVYNPYWRNRSNGTCWQDSNLLDRFISLLQLRPYTRKELGYVALKNGYDRAIVSQCLDLLPILEYIELWDEYADKNPTYLYTLPAHLKPEDVW